MISFTDITLVESRGNYLHTKEIMENEGPSLWMLETSASIVTESIASSFVLHLWSDRRVYIMATSHPLTMDAPDSDLRALKDWCELNGWHKPIVHNDLIESPKEFEFWLRMFYIGLVFSEILDKHEKDEMQRMDEAYQREQLEDEELDNAY